MRGMNMKDNPCHEEENAFTDALTEYRKQKTNSQMQPGLEPIPGINVSRIQKLTVNQIESKKKKVAEAKKRCEEAMQKRRECWDKHKRKHSDDRFKDCDDYG
jgi:hypothetical protein